MNLLNGKQMAPIARNLAALVLLWVGIATIQAGQAYLVALWRGEPQAWWPSLGYAVAIHSVWCVLTPPLIAAAQWLDGRSAPLKIAAYLALWPVAVTLHVVLFAWLWWPVYNDGGRLATRWAMADVMLVRNLAINSLYYAGIVSITIVALRGDRRRPSLDHNTIDALVVRMRGTVRRVPLTEIDWIAAAGDYVEVHSGGVTHLIEEPLRSLAERLPARDFVRIHRSSVVRIDRIRNVETLGHGDARIRLVSGVELRLSRRYRKNLELLTI